jgi:hypothetical protein
MDYLGVTGYIPTEIGLLSALTYLCVTNAALQ